MELDADYDEDLERSVQKAEAKLAQLLKGPHEPDRLILAPADPPVTIAEYWQSLTTPKERNDYLRNTVTTFYASQEGIMGQLGWMALDSANVNWSDFRRALRFLKAPFFETWESATERMAKYPQDFAATV
jgi:hypothetical protein